MVHQKVHLNVRKDPLECTKRSTRMHKKVHYYNLLDQRCCIVIIIQISILDTIEDLNQFLLSNQLRHACSKTIQRKVHFLCAKNLPAKLPGYGLVIGVGVYTAEFVCYLRIPFQIFFLNPNSDIRRVLIFYMFYISFLKILFPQYSDVEF